VSTGGGGLGGGDGGGGDGGGGGQGGIDGAAPVTAKLERVAAPHDGDV